MAGITRRIIAMIGYTLLQGHLGNLRIGEIHLGHIGRRRGRGIVQHAFQHPDPALEGMGILAVRIHRQHRRAGHQPAALVLGLKGHLAEMQAVHIRNPVKLRQLGVDHRVIRMNEIHDTAVVLQHMFKKGNRLLCHGSPELIVLDMIHAVQAIQPEPLANEMPSEAFGAWIGQHAVHLRGQHFWLPQFPSLGQIKQRLVRNTRPKKHRQPAGQFEFADARGCRLGSAGIALGQVEEFRMRQHCRQHLHHRAFERLKLRSVFAEQFHKPVHFRRADRSPPRTAHETLQHLARIHRLVFAIAALKENRRVRLGRPLRVEWRGDLHVIKLNVQPVHQRHVSNVQKLVAPRERGFQFAERITLNVVQLNVEMNELRLARRRLHWHIPLADHV